MPQWQIKPSNIHQNIEENLQELKFKLEDLHGSTTADTRLQKKEM